MRVNAGYGNTTHHSIRFRCTGDEPSRKHIFYAMKAPFFPCRVMVSAFFLHAAALSSLVSASLYWYWRDGIIRREWISASNMYGHSTKNRFRGRVRVLSRDRGKRGPDRRPARQANNDTVSIVRTSVDRPVIRAEPTRGLFTHTRPTRAEMSIESN